MSGVDRLEPEEKLGGISDFRPEKNEPRYENHQRGNSDYSDYPA
jgi:hypothetical protein